MLEFDRVTFDPEIMGGRACLRGMRITVSLVVNLIANGMTTADILKEYPLLEPEDIQQALRYAAWLMEEKVFPVELSMASQPASDLRHIGHNQRTP